MAAAPDNPNAPPAVVLLSGGLDSATTLAIARARGFACHALTFEYGQRHRHELAAAERIAESLPVADHRVARLDLTAAAGLGRSALTDEMEVPKDRLDDGHIPVTYVPARNTIFLSLALARAEVLGAWDIFIGVNAVDYSGYPDCRPGFIEQFERLANLATAAAVEGNGRYTIHAPLLHMSKAEIIRTGLELGVDYSLTHSCYDPAPDGAACGHCDACRLRLAGFKDAGATDPAKYR
ncbi:MAG: 7-cyano-7-deazaguanine synthase QueC [Phycisphaerae bacterium]